ncbi:MAG: FAD-binding oxidoreductase [Pseudomonadales bacterium]|nr:FAD-binding oxidoreductase [Pseudomonadales bacterium]
MENIRHSWGRYFRYQQQEQSLYWRCDSLPTVETSLLPFGLGRSYGDSCLNEHGVLLHASALNRFIAFNRETGLLRCEAGVSLADILALSVSQGWFLPVTPGTKFVTVGGAIANDVHGKNHIAAGTWGRHITAFELLRSNGERLLCTPTQNAHLFRATIGGLGLTGFITWAEVQLSPVCNAFVNDESYQCQNLDHCLQWFEQSRASHQYRVAWLDCLTTGSALGRSIFSRANHCQDPALPKQHHPRRKLSVPITFPPRVLNRYTVQGFNALYFRKLNGVRKNSRLDYDSFFYPLDSIHHWNRIYGPKGFLQYQCVLTKDTRDALHVLLRRIAASGQASFLSVLKEFGDLPSPGMLSFPRRGYTLALDFANRGQETLKLLNDLDAIVREAEGAVYPAKDARMSAAMFRESFPALNNFAAHIDPLFSSSFWCRVCP